MVITVSAYKKIEKIILWSEKLKISLPITVQYKILNKNSFFFKDKKWPVTNIEDEIHNIQAVIDSISMDLLHEDLSHLTGESMVFGYNKNGHKSKSADLVSIEYLLDIIRSLNEWISSRIESHVDENEEEEKEKQQEVSVSKKKQEQQPPPQPVKVHTVSTSPIMSTASFQHLTDKMDDNKTKQDKLTEQQMQTRQLAHAHIDSNNVIKSLNYF